jgi:hypothetical protein
MRRIMVQSLETTALKGFKQKFKTYLLQIVIYVSYS